MNQFPAIGGRPLQLDEIGSDKPGSRTLYRTLFSEVSIAPFGCQR